MIRWGTCHYCGCATFQPFFKFNKKNIWKKTSKTARRRQRMLREAHNQPNRHSADHVIPKSQGGKITVDCCNACNRVKAHYDYEVFKALRAEYIDRWQPGRHIPDEIKEEFKSKLIKGSVNEKK